MTLPEGRKPGSDYIRVVYQLPKGHPVSAGWTRGLPKRSGLMERNYLLETERMVAYTIGSSHQLMVIVFHHELLA